MAALWTDLSIAGQQFQLLNLEHPQISKKILAEMDAGIAVYYDCRWQATEIFSQQLLQHPYWVADKSVCILGAGVGLETVIIGQLCQQLFLNDLAPVALELCAWQLRHNNINSFTLLPGNYKEITLPDVDLIVASFLIYNQDGAESMRQLLQQTSSAVLLMNELLPAFQKFLRTTPSTPQQLFYQDSAIAYLFPPLNC